MSDECVPRRGTAAALFLALGEALDVFLRDHPSAEAILGGGTMFMACVLATVHKRGLHPVQIYAACSGLAMLPLAEHCLLAGNAANDVLRDEAGLFIARTEERIAERKAQLRET